MSYVEPASADSRVLTSSTQTPSVDAELGTNVSVAVSEDFASLFASTRRSLTWLNGLFDRKSDQVVADQRRQRQVTDDLSHKNRDDTSSRTATSEINPSESRADQLRESAYERDQTIDRQSDAYRDRNETADSVREKHSAVENNRADSSRQTQQTELSEQTRRVDCESVERTSQQQERVSHELTSASPAGSATTNDAATSSNSPTSSSVANNSTPIGMPQTQGQSSLTIQTQVSAAVPNIQAAVAAVSAKGGELQQGVSQDLLQASSSVKSAEGAAKPSAVTIDFQTLLAQAGKGQANGTPPSNGLSAMTGKQSVGETIKLANTESVQELARVVRSNLNGRHASMVLRLDPPELGQLRVDVRMHHQELTLRFQTETQAGMDALQSKISDLRAALEQQGIRLDHVQIEFRPPTAQNTEHQQDVDRQFQQETPDNSHSAFGHAQGHDDSAGESFGSSRFANEFDQASSETPPAEEIDLWGDDVAHPAETGVDLVV